MKEDASRNRAFQTQISDISLVLRPANQKLLQYQNVSSYLAGKNVFCTQSRSLAQCLLIDKMDVHWYPCVTKELCSSDPAKDERSLVYTTKERCSPGGLTVSPARLFTFGCNGIVYRSF